MATELELKAPVTDPGALRARLQAAGARCTFRGMMRDRRLDLAGSLTARDEVLRVRSYEASEPAAGGPGAVLGWKGAVSVSPEGYKRREELECRAADAPSLLAVLDALGYRPVQVIDRFVEIYELSGTVVRLEWYPRMDVLAEIEGEPAGMEQAIARLGLRRADCLAEALAFFAARYESRTGRPAVLAEADLQDEPPSWRSA